MQETVLERETKLMQENIETVEREKKHLQELYEASIAEILTENDKVNCLLFYFF